VRRSFDASVLVDLTGAQLRKNADGAVLAAEGALGQFEWVDLDGRVAEKAAELLAYLRVTSKPVGFQDATACALEFGAKMLVTENREHFERFPPLQGKGFTAKEADGDWRRGSPIPILVIGA